MIEREVELHNVCETVSAFGGMLLERLPGEVRGKMENFRTFKAEYCAGCEIRFVSEAYVTQVTLTCLYNAGIITVYCGEVTYLTRRIREGETVTLHLERPEFFDTMVTQARKKGFAPAVWRIHLPAAKIVLKDVNSFGQKLRPPRPEEKPAQTFLAYGSSITQGEQSVDNALAYVHQTARLLCADVCNLGFSGACFCEPALAEHIASREDWDFALLELGVNMRLRFTPEIFRQRAEYLIDQVCGNHPDKKVFAVTIYPNAATWQKNQYWDHEKTFNGILREICETKYHQNLTLIEGCEVMTSSSYLNQDLIHPSDFGHMEMGRNLAALLRRYI